MSRRGFHRARSSKLHWMVLAMSVIILLAVGADYNLLLVSRFKEEIHAGLNTGIIRSMGSTGSVVTSAGLVFAFTTYRLLTSDCRAQSARSIRGAPACPSRGGERGRR